MISSKELNSSFSTSFHKNEISGMYLNIFDVPKPYNETTKG
jgi:hypothetical protein